MRWIAFSLLFAGIPMSSWAQIPVRSWELSGRVDYAHVSSGGASSNALSLDPGISYYPAANLFVGPLLGYTRSWSDAGSGNSARLGAQAGYILSSAPAGVYPYAGAGASFLSAWNGGSSSGFAVTAFAGLKFPLTSSFMLNLQPMLTHAELGNIDSDTFAVALAFSGILAP